MLVAIPTETPSEKTDLPFPGFRPRVESELTCAIALPPHSALPDRPRLPKDSTAAPQPAPATARRPAHRGRSRPGEEGSRPGEEGHRLAVECPQVKPAHSFQSLWSRGLAKHIADVGSWWNCYCGLILCGERPRVHLIDRESSSALRKEGEPAAYIA